MVSSYPEADRNVFDPEAERVLASLIEIVHAIRNVRAQYNVPGSKWFEARIHAYGLTSNLAYYSEVIQALARVRPVVFEQGRPKDEAGGNLLRLVLKETEVLLPMETVVDLEAERKRLKQEIEATQLQISRLESRLGDEAFLTKAPQAVTDKERQRLKQAKDKLERLKQSIKA